MKEDKDNVYVVLNHPSSIFISCYIRSILIVITLEDFEYYILNIIYSNMILRFWIKDFKIYIFIIFIQNFLCFVLWFLSFTLYGFFT